MSTAVVPSDAASADPFMEQIEALLPSAYRLSFAMLQSQAEAEDALQEAMLRAWRARLRLREGSDVRPWFLTIVANQCRRQRRSRWWSVLKGTELPEPSSGDLPDDGIAVLRQALARLSHRDRLVLVMRYYLDQPFEEIGRVQGVSAGAAKARVHRALARLRVEVPEDLGDA
jgi:RNA polymerase sigma-70 factor (ECF subfamily)